MTMLAELRESGLRALNAAGWAGVLGIGLCVFAVSFDLTGNRALADEADQLRREARSLAKTQRQHRRVPEVSERERLAAFYAGLPLAERLPELLLRLHGHALARGVPTDKADYRVQAVAGTPLEQVSLELPVRASYPAIRQWLDDVRAGMPELALDDLAFRRADIGKPDIEARVRFVIFLRRPA